MTASSPTATDAPRSQTAVAVALATLILGVAMVYTVGFAHSSTLHNAGHDTRHAMAFPCH